MNTQQGKRWSRVIETLDALAHGADSLSAVLEAIITTPHGGFRAVEYKRRRIIRARELADISHERRRSLSILLSKLCKEGLVAHKDGLWRIVPKGLEKLRALKKSLLPSTRYAAPRGEKSPIIITFDIPEKERNKRAWLRAALRNLDFSMLHQSVWVGKCAPPKEFIDDIERLSLRERIHILAVTKSGTIKNL